jgi:glucosamine kinase
VNGGRLLLGIDGGGTRCRARLTAFSGQPLGEAETGPANLRLGLRQCFAAVREAAELCLKQAGRAHKDLTKIVACLALAGATEPSLLAAAQVHKHPFAAAIITTDAHAACIGAHGERDGGILVVGTGTIGWAVLKGQSYRVGGWGLPLSDEGSGAWLGVEALRRALWARDGRIAWTPVLRELFAIFDNDAHAIVHWTETASPRDFGSFAPRVVECAQGGDPIAAELMTEAAIHVDALAARLIAAGADRLSLVGGCGRFMHPWLSAETKSRLTEPLSDALAGALHLARSAARSSTRAA